MGAGGQASGPERMGAAERAGTPERIDVPGRPTLSKADLERWQESGATWRALEITDAGAVVELCTCTGEPVDVLAGSDADLVAFVRAARATD